ncbi:hypothetical protein JCM10908_002492 [Rhodotorula pacifica]|uniref:Ist2p n=1 Tax=Rhodotorula pacifica TaxID=1495444 RepID=UPI00317658C3
MDPRPDYVIVFSTDPNLNSPVRGLSTEKDSTLRAKRAAQLSAEYDRLLTTLRQADCQVTSRRAATGTNAVLIFVKADERRVREEATRERMSDWLHGLASPRPSPREPRDFAAEPIEPAERLRLVYGILTSPRTTDTPSIRSAAATGNTCGLPLASQLPPTPPNKADFPHLLDIFPPHDTVFNRLWLKRWAHFPTERLSEDPLAALSIPQHELDDLKAHLGEKVAIYFAFLGFYARSLAFPSILGAFFWLLGLRFHPLLGVGFIGWSVMFVETWRVRERALAVQWGTHRLERVELERPGFQGDGREPDPVTGVARQRWSFGRTLTRGLASLPAYALFVAGLGTIVAVIYAVETIVGEVYDGPFKRILMLLPTVLFVSVVPQVNTLWAMTAGKLTAFENHPRQSEHEASLAIKTFALNFVSAYGNLLLTSYVYIPFGSALVPHIISRLPTQHTAAIRAAASGSFGINATKLHTQLIAYTLTNQISGAFLEVGLPYLKAKLLPAVQEKLHRTDASAAQDAADADDSEEEKGFLSRIRQEQLLPTNEIFGEYAEMATQLGYLTLFAVVWPISPLWSLINNVIEIRSDAFKLATQARRPIPTRAASIGPWLDVLGFITYVGSLTTSSLVYLYQERQTAPGKSAQYLTHLTHKNVTLPASGASAFWATRLSEAQSITLPPPSDAPQLMGALPPATGGTDALDAVKSLLLSAALIALVSSHAYAAARALARWLLVRLEWDGSIAHQLVRRRDLELKRAWLDEHDMRMTPIQMTRHAMGWAEKRAEENGEENTAGDQLKQEGGVGAPADAAAAPSTESNFWRHEDVGRRIVHVNDKTE